MKTTITTLCIVLYALSANAQSNGDFRSKKNGSWSDTSVWQKYNGSKWIAARAYPKSSNGIITIQDTNVITIDLDLTLDQVIVAPGGELDMPYNYTLTLTGSGNALTNNGFFNWTSGTINGSTAKILNNGNLSWLNADLSASLINSSTGTVAVRTGADNLYSPSTFTNNGTVNWYSSGNLVFYDGAIINNNSVFNIWGSGRLQGSGTFNNNSSGIVNVQPGASYVELDVTFYNKGTMNFISGTFYNYGGNFINTKTLNFSGGVYQNRSTASLGTGTSITGTGSIVLESNTLTVDAASTSLPEGVSLNIFGGSAMGGTGKVSINGKMFLTNGSISCNVTIKPSGIMYIGADYYTYLENTLTNNGTINWIDWDLQLSNGYIINNGTFNIYADNTIYYSGAGTFTNNKAGTVIKHSLGNTTVSLPFSNSGTIRGEGTFDFGTNLTNTGTFEPGIGTSTGILHTGDNYTNKKLSIKINGTSPGSDFDRLLVKGNINLGTDTLKVIATGTIDPGSYIILSCNGARTGTFKVLQLPAGYSVTYKPNRVLLNVPASSLNNNAEAEKNTIEKSTVTSKQFSIFPNPAKEIVNIHFSGTGTSANISVFDAKGQRVKAFSMPLKDYMQVNVGSLAAGTYLIQISDGVNTQNEKLVKE